MLQNIMKLSSRLGGPLLTENLHIGIVVVFRRYDKIMTQTKLINAHFLMFTLNSSRKAHYEYTRPQMPILAICFIAIYAVY